MTVTLATPGSFLCSFKYPNVYPIVGMREEGKVSLPKTLSQPAEFNRYFLEIKI